MNPYPSYHPSTADTAPPLLGLWGRILNTTSLYGEVLLRSRFGERHLTLPGLLLALAGLLFLPMVIVAVGTFFFSSFLFGSMGGLFAALVTSQLPWAQGTIYFHLFTLGFLGRACWHFIEMEYRRRAGEQLLSTYSGMPNVLWRLIPVFGENEGHIKRYGEPAVLLLLALWVRHTDFLLTMYLGASGVAMFVKGHFEAFLVNQRLYTLHDQMLESQALGGHMQGYSHQPGDQYGVALPAALAEYQPHQARALSSTLQNQFPVTPLPNTVPTAPDVSAIAASLPPVYAGLLSEPAAVEEPAVDWYFTETDDPVVDDWYETDPAPDAGPAKAAEKVRRTVRCPHCQQQGKAPVRSGRNGIRCWGCNKKFTVTYRPRQLVS